ncbi:hypothetical protein Clacol_002815 [Clathrus columnatus]|uniref:Guanine nucleotide-binding protein-like 1 n=1 Tax=Clathrus columnatus TaxID=1419009 RepID=A0AAV5A1R4_9AGAM|nr:hypothetical protein Clacol_002815 [Clathrus columnatus]
MPRRQNISNKQRKAELQLKRAVKRGEGPFSDSVSPEIQVIPDPNRRPKHTINSAIRERLCQQSSKKLESSFLKVTPEFLEATKLLASITPLPRPLSSNVAILSKSDIDLSGDDMALSCLKRPKWRFDMTKKEVEANEEGLFRKWLAETDSCISQWIMNEYGQGFLPESHSRGTHIYPYYYERNLEIWRQLWRVTEISHILIILLDSRCPALHFPPSLRSFLSSLNPPRPLIFALTKTDIVPESYISAWTRWFQAKYPSARVVSVRANSTAGTNATNEYSKLGIKHGPYIPEGDDGLSELVKAMQKSYEELMTPPEKIKDDPEKLQHWHATRMFATKINWNQVPSRIPQEDFKANDKYITIGLIGQPNVGKSSLLNALFGSHKVKASRTPGKTKHYQTLFWTPEIRLVDCPGLVFPQLVRMELQVLGGILPISRIPSIPACTHYALQLLPLEWIFQLKPASGESNANVDVDKRTWRDQKVTQQKHRTFQWTTMNVLTAFAVHKGWLTAKAGRPDINRAGNYILRSLAEGRIRWAFWPPEAEGVPITRDSGIWLGGGVVEVEGEEEEEEENDSAGDNDFDSSLSNDTELNEDSEGMEITLTSGRFEVLALNSIPDEVI